MYPGVYRRLNSEEIGKQLAYAVAVNAFPLLNQKWIIDASHLRYNCSYVGHLVNSCHPCLPFPYNEANCELIEEQAHEFDNSCRPPLVFLCVSEKADIPAGRELTLDYHWMLLNMRCEFMSVRLQSCGCIHCEEQ